METGREGAFGTRELMRDVNDRTWERLQSASVEKIEFICECGAVSCFETVALRPAEFEALRTGGGSLLAPGHTGPAVDDLGTVSTSSPSQTDRTRAERS